MTGNKKVSVELDESITSEVRTGDDKKISVKGKGDILVQTKKEQSVFLVFSKFRDSKHNFLHFGQLQL